jgi:molybdenum cofactor cytidylyltransferase
MGSDMRVAAIILAAGASRRLGRPKQLVTYNGETLVARAIRIAREAGFQPVIVVLGAERETVRAAVGEADVIFVENEGWREGIASSMRAGISALDHVFAKPEGVLIMPCDQPRLSDEHLTRLRDLFVQDTEPGIVASFYEGVRGVPAVFPRTAFQELMKLSGDVGARRLLADPAHPVIDVPFAGGAIDIDSPEDMEHLQ